MATEEEDRNPEPTEQEKEQMAEIKKISEEVTEQNKKRDDSYDDKIKSLETRKKLLPTDERAEEEHLARVQGLREEFEELKSKISTARKAGKDPFIASVLIKTIPAKIKMAEVTREQKDFDAVAQEIKRATEELELAEKEEPVDVKKEIERRLRADVQRETGKAADDEEEEG